MTKRPVRDVNDGTYHINGKKFPELIGSRTQVHNKTAYKTPGGLTISNLMMNKWGRIVSVLKHKTAKKEKRLEKAGYFAKKGKFGYVKKSAKNGRKTAKKGSRKMRGGGLECVDGSLPKEGVCDDGQEPVYKSDNTPPNTPVRLDE